MQFQVLPRAFSRQLLLCVACSRASRLSCASIHICLQPRAMRSYHALALGVAFLLVILALIVLIGHLHWNSGPCTFPSWNSTEYALHPDLCELDSNPHPSPPLLALIHHVQAPSL